MAMRLPMCILLVCIAASAAVRIHSEENLHSRIRNRKHSSHLRDAKHHAKNKDGKTSIQHKDAKTSIRHKHAKTSSQHAGGKHSAKQLDGALALLSDAIRNSNRNAVAPQMRFKQRAPFRSTDDPSSKTISMGDNGDGYPGADNGGEDDNQDDPNTNYRVLPVASKGLRMEPMPGMKDPTIFVRAPENFGSDANITKGYVRESQLSSLDMIKDAIDVSENRIKGLKLRVVEKQNFLDSLRKREKMLDADVSQDKTAVRNLLSHIDALDMRLTRLKKENELKQLSEMYENYTATAVHLEGQAAGLSNARNALFDRIQYMHNTIGGLRQREEADARQAVDGSDETLQAYGYSGALKDRKESLQNDMSSQMQQMAYQQQLLQQQLAFMSGNNGVVVAANPALAGNGNTGAKKPGAKKPGAKGAKKPPAKK